MHLDKAINCNPNYCLLGTIKIDWSHGKNEDHNGGTERKLDEIIKMNRNNDSDKRAINDVNDVNKSIAPSKASSPQRAVYS
jgi:hypothetical protein